MNGVRYADCHPNRKYHCRGLCKQCYGKQYAESHKEELKEYYHQKYLEKRDDVIERTKKYAKRFPEKFNAWSRGYCKRNPLKNALRHKIYNTNNKEKVEKRAKKYRLKNKDRIAKRGHDNYMSNPRKARAKRLKKYGLTIEDFENMLESQGGLCAICGKDNNGKTFHVDHNHDTGKVRQLLCNACNIGLRSLQDDIEIVEKALNYLRKHNHD